MYPPANFRFLDNMTGPNYGNCRHFAPLFDTCQALAPILPIFFAIFLGMLWKRWVSRNRLRLDEILVCRGLCPNRTKARGLILAGKVRRGTEVLDKPGKRYEDDIPLTLLQPPPYVSRGGEKLDRYLKSFPTEIRGKVALDVGASTGGFTDCLLQKGAAECVCVDVGRGQLHYKLRRDERVRNVERVNARHLTADCLPYPSYDLIVMDLSFISLTKVLPAVWPLLEPRGKLIALVKPQFEAGKSVVDKGKGVIRDDEIPFQVLRDIQAWVRESLKNAALEGWVESPLGGGNRNREFLLGIVKTASEP